MTKIKALDQARVLSAHLRTQREQNFLQAFQNEPDLQAAPSALRFLSSLWAKFLATSQGQALIVATEARPRDHQEARKLRVLRAKLEQGGRLSPIERDLLEELAAPPEQRGADPELVHQVQEVLGRLSNRARSDRDARALCAHMQQWLRKQGTP